MGTRQLPWGIGSRHEGGWGTYPATACVLPPGSHGSAWTVLLSLGRKKSPVGQIRGHRGDRWDGTNKEAPGIAATKPGACDDDKNTLKLYQDLQRMAMALRGLLERLADPAAAFPGERRCLAWQRRKHYQRASA